MAKRKGTGRQNSRKKSVKLSRYRRSIVMICMVLICLSGVLAVNSVSLHARNSEYAQQEKELKAQIAEQEKRSKEVEAFKEYVKTDEYIKETAEEKLGLVDPDEIVFKAEE